MLFSATYDHNSGDLKTGALYSCLGNRTLDPSTYLISCVRVYKGEILFQDLYSFNLVARSTNFSKDEIETMVKQANASGKLKYLDKARITDREGWQACGL